MAEWLIANFPFGFDGRILDSIVSVPGHRMPFTFEHMEALCFYFDAMTTFEGM